MTLKIPQYKTSQNDNGYFLTFDIKSFSIEFRDIILDGSDMLWASLGCIGDFCSYCPFSADGIYSPTIPDPFNIIPDIVMD